MPLDATPLISLSFLTEDETLRQVCRRYWAVDDTGRFVDTVETLANEFELAKSQVSKLAQQYCEAFSNQHLCLECHKPFKVERRTDYLNLRSWTGERRCKKCNDERRLQEIKASLEAELKRKGLIRATVEKIYGVSELTRVKPLELSLEHATFLLSLVRAGASEDFSIIQVVDSFAIPLSPTSGYDYEILERLYRAKLLAVHIDSAPDAFFDDPAKGFYLGRVIWRPAISAASGDTKGLASEIELIFRSGHWPAAWWDQRVNLWKIVAVQECIEYLQLCMKQHGFEFNPGDKTSTVFMEILNNYSVAQIYNLIWRVAKDTAAYYVRESVGKAKAANTAISSLQRYAERAYLGQWPIKPFRRSYECPQSMVSQVLYNVVLKIGDAGFELTPNLANLSASQLSDGAIQRH